MNANFGILKAADKKIRDKKERYRYLAERSLATIKQFKEEIDK
jgi:methylenetetrahydrofolate--tRNA-(uracil-5-)-methyltransferase